MSGDRGETASREALQFADAFFSSGQRLHDAKTGRMAERLENGGFLLEHFV